MNVLSIFQKYKIKSSSCTLHEKQYKMYFLFQKMFLHYHSLNSHISDLKDSFFLYFAFKRQDLGKDTYSDNFDRLFVKTSGLFIKNQ